MRKRKEYIEAEDNIKLVFPRKEMVFEQFHIDFQKGIIYNKKLWDQKIERICGGDTSSRLYKRVNIKLPDHLAHLSSKGWVEVLAHRLIFYAYYGFLTEKIDHNDKKVKYQNAISNLSHSDSFHNNLNVEKIVRKKKSGKSKNNCLEQYKGISFSYGLYWARYKGKIINQIGFISPILAVDFRNRYIVKKYYNYYKEKGISNIPPFPKLALDIIDKNELFLDQMLQEVAEKNQDFILKNQNIQAQKKKAIETKNKNKQQKENLKNKISIIYEEEDPFECIGKYE